jgi:hypothetical protein
MPPVAIMVFMSVWNDITIPLYFLTNSADWTMPLSVYCLISAEEVFPKIEQAVSSKYYLIEPKKANFYKTHYLDNGLSDIIIIVTS